MKIKDLILRIMVELEDIFKFVVGGIVGGLSYVIFMDGTDVAKRWLMVVLGIMLIITFVGKFLIKKQSKEGEELMWRWTG